MRKEKTTCQSASLSPLSETTNVKQAREIGQTFAESLILGVRSEQRALYLLDLPTEPAPVPSRHKQAIAVKARAVQIEDPVKEEVTF